MAVGASDIRFFKAVGADGGAIDTNAEIVSGVLNNLFTDVTASEAEAGVTRYFKFFIRNTNATDSATGTLVCLANFTAGDDYVRIFPGTADDTTANFNKTKLYGVAQCAGELDRATKQVTVTTEKSVAVSDIFAVSDKITFVNNQTGEKIVSATIAAISGSTITVNEDIPADIVLDGSYVGNSIDIGTFAAGQDVAVWIEQVVPAFSTAMEDPADSFSVAIYFDA